MHMHWKEGFGKMHVKPELKLRFFGFSAIMSAVAILWCVVIGCDSSASAIRLSSASLKSTENKEGYWESMLGTPRNTDSAAKEN